MPRGMLAGIVEWDGGGGRLIELYQPEPANDHLWATGSTETDRASERPYWWSPEPMPEGGRHG